MQRTPVANARLYGAVLAVAIMVVAANAASAQWAGVGWPNPRDDSAVLITGGTTPTNRPFYWIDAAVEDGGHPAGTDMELWITENGPAMLVSWRSQGIFTKTTNGAEVFTFDSNTVVVDRLEPWPYPQIPDPFTDAHTDPGFQYTGLRSNRFPLSLGDYLWRINEVGGPDGVTWGVRVPMCAPTHTSSDVSVGPRFIWDEHPDGLSSFPSDGNQGAVAQEHMYLVDMDEGDSDYEKNLVIDNNLVTDRLVKIYTGGGGRAGVREYYWPDTSDEDNNVPYERLLPDGRNYAWRILYCDEDGVPLFNDVDGDGSKADDGTEPFLWADGRDDDWPGWTFSTVFEVPEYRTAAVESVIIYHQSMYGLLPRDVTGQYDSIYGTLTFNNDIDFWQLAMSLEDIHENVHHPSVETVRLGSQEVAATYGGLHNDDSWRARCDPQAPHADEVTDFDGWYTKSRSEKNDDDFPNASQDDYDEMVARGIRTYLQDAANDNGFTTPDDFADLDNLQYVVLLGEARRVPPSFYFYFSGPGDNWVATDFFYSSQTASSAVSTRPAYQVSRIPIRAAYYYETEDGDGNSYPWPSSPPVPEEPLATKVRQYAALLNSDARKNAAYGEWFGRAVVASAATEWEEWYQFFPGFTQNLLSSRVDAGGGTFRDTFSGMKVLPYNIWGLVGDEQLTRNNVLQHLIDPQEDDVPGFVYLPLSGDGWDPAVPGDTAELDPTLTIIEAADFPADSYVGIWGASLPHSRRPLMVAPTSLINRFDNDIFGNTADLSLGQAAVLAPGGPIGVIGFASADYQSSVDFETVYPDQSTLPTTWSGSVDDYEGYTYPVLEDGVLKLEKDGDPDVAVLGKVEFVKKLAREYQRTTKPGMGNIFNHVLDDYITEHEADFLAQDRRVATTAFGACLLGDCALVMPQRQPAASDYSRPDVSDVNPRPPTAVPGYEDTDQYNLDGMPIHSIPRYDPDVPGDNQGVDVNLQVQTDSPVVRVRVLTPFQQNINYVPGWWYDPLGEHWAYTDPDADGDGEWETTPVVGGTAGYTFTVFTPSVYLVVVQAQNPAWQQGVDGAEWRWLQERWLYLQAVNTFQRDPDCNILVMDQDQPDRHYLNGHWYTNVEDYYINPNLDGAGYEVGEDPRDFTDPPWSLRSAPAISILNKELGEDIGAAAPFPYQYWCTGVYCTAAPGLYNNDNAEILKDQQRYYGDLTPGAMKSFGDTGGIILTFSGDASADPPWGYLFRYDSVNHAELWNLESYLILGGKYCQSNQTMPGEPSYIASFQEDYLGATTVTTDTDYTNMDGLFSGTMSQHIQDVNIQGGDGEGNATWTAEFDPNGIAAATVFTWDTASGVGTIGGTGSSAIQNRLVQYGSRTLDLSWPFEAVDYLGEVDTGESGRVNVMRRILGWLRNVPKATNPTPPDGATGVPLDGVDPTDPERDLTWGRIAEAGFYNVYLGPNAPANMVLNGAGINRDTPWHDWTNPVTADPLLAPGTTYYWRVDAANPDGVTVTTGDVWSFTTAAGGQATGPFPADGATGVPADVILLWNAPAGVAVQSYDVYLGVGGVPPTATATGLGTEQYDPPGDLTIGLTYFWRVDTYVTGIPNPVQGPVWSFTVLSGGPATNPFPADGAGGVDPAVTLSWTGVALTYDLYLGEGALPATPVATGLAFTNYTPLSPLIGGSTYYWRVDSNYLGGLVVPGSVWTFTVALPGQATNPDPPDGATGVAAGVALSWTGTGDDYDIYLGLGALPGAPTATALGGPPYTPAAPLANGTYFWRVDSNFTGTGTTVVGAIWTFIVGAGGGPGGGGGGGGGACFIATSALEAGGPVAAAFEPNCTGLYVLTPERLAQLDRVRALRDGLLMTVEAGRRFSAWYYALGPYAAEAIRHREPAKSAVRGTLLGPLARLSEACREEQ